MREIIEKEQNSLGKFGIPEVEFFFIESKMKLPIKYSASE